MYFHIYSKYNLFRMYNVTFMYVYKAYSVVLGSSMVCYSVGKSNSPDPSFPQLFTVLWMMLKTSVFFLI